ncbi:MAG: acVLRF1 family peptidyl-tRNA hydrolase [Jatrophihabitans sp.]|uniref:acVLRF1 family peptidyl-tRNA hydrolase n=1 Tax=Jatrophihabitans sp. TaxID=1932789 RepID=UPI003F7DE49E
MSERRVSIGFARLPRWLDGFAERHGPPTVTATPDEVHLVGGDGAQAWLAVPFPPLPDGDDPLTALANHVTRERTVGVVLVRRGGHAVGLFRGAELVASKVDSSYVQGTTKAGGWSQQRYARRRANQSRAAFADAAATAARVLLPHAGELDAVVAGGDRLAVDEVFADPQLAPLAALRTGPLLAVPDPRLRVLQATPEQFLAVPVRLDP